MRSFAINSYMFDQPGFKIMFQAWSDVFEVHDDGTPVLNVDDAIQRTIVARKEAEVITGLDSDALNTIEHTACRYAQVMPVFVEERLSA